jgi:transcription elongation GreA/GreB family factor
MSDTTARMACKTAVRDRMLALEQAELDFAEDKHERFTESSLLDDRDNWDKDDMALSRTAADQAAALDQPVFIHTSKIEALEDMDFGLTDTVGLGAIVVVDGRNFVVAVSTSKFDCDGEKYMGISESSPIYRAMADLKKGETFELNGKTLTIDDVF